MGSGEARIEAVEVLGPEGEPRLQFASGEPMTLRLRLVAEGRVPPPRLTVELRGESGLLLGALVRDTAELGWPEGGGELAARLDLDRLPFAEGRFHVRLGLADETGARLYHQLDRAAWFAVHPGDGERGLVRLEGRWTREEIGAAAELSR